MPLVMMTTMMMTGLVTCWSVDHRLDPRCCNTCTQTNISSLSAAAATTARVEKTERIPQKLTTHLITNNKIFNDHGYIFEIFKPTIFRILVYFSCGKAK